MATTILEIDSVRVDMGYDIMFKLINMMDKVGLIKADKELLGHEFVTKNLPVLETEDDVSRFLQVLRTFRPELSSHV